MPLRELLAFRLAHAHARDAVYSLLETERLLGELEEFKLPVYHVRSQAENRSQYLQRPDLGRTLHEDSSLALQDSAPASSDVALVLADGLSATALNQHALPLLRLLVPRLQQASFQLAPLTVAEQARVALSDEIGAALHAQLVLILIGERPGLSSPDSWVPTSPMVPGPASPMMHATAFPTSARKAYPTPPRPKSCFY